MTQYIDKDVLISEIYRLRDFANDRWDVEEVNGVDKFLDKLIPFIKSLEVKEVDLEKEIQGHLRECLNIKFPTTNVTLIASDVEYTARKFFELGFKVNQKCVKSNKNN